MSESFREKRFGRQLLSFQIRIEDHRQIANEDSAEPGAPDLVPLEENQPILAGWFETMQLVCKIFIEIDAKFAPDLVLETSEGLVIVDHKSFPGGREEALERARTLLDVVRLDRDGVRDARDGGAVSSDLGQRVVASCGGRAW